MTGYIVVHEEGTYRGFPSKYWGSLEDQIRDATAQNLENHTSMRHITQELWMWTEDCGHPNPDEDEKYDGIDDELDEWSERNLFGLTWSDGNLYYKNRERGRAVLDRCAEFDLAMTKWENVHVGSVCMDSYMGTCCIHENCTEGSEDSGYEVAPCRRQDNAKEAQDAFWAEFAELGV